MNDVKQWLKTGDPVSDGPGLSPIDAAKMRRVIVAAVDSDTAPRIAGAWPGPFAMAVVVAASLVFGVGIGLRLDPGPGKAAPKRGNLVVGVGERRQMQFATGGGTRIIWTFSSEF